MIEVRFFAAAREAAGTSGARIAADSVGELRTQLVKVFGARMEQVLMVSSLVSDGRRLSDDDPVADGTEIDVLPPFAGG